ncbi:leucine rich repeat [Phlyctochytrium planicorne]|nr:leucine rich repeat [Phlyctochytrium planicorne]
MAKDFEAHHLELVRMLKEKDKELAQLSSEVMGREKQKQELLDELDVVKRTVKEYENAKNKVTVRLLKERESSRIMIAELHKEKEIYSESIMKLEKEVSFLQEALQGKDADLFAKLERTTLMLRKDSELKAEALVANVTMAKDKEITTLKDELHRTKLDLSNLESQSQIKIRESEEKLGKASESMQKIQDEFNYRGKVITSFENKEREMIMTVRKLTALVEDQKRHIVDLEERNEASLSFFQEKIKSLQEQLKSMISCESTLKMIREQLEASKEEISKKDQMLLQLQGQLHTVNADSSEKHLAYSQERGQLIQKVKEIEDARKNLEDQHQLDVQTLRIKEKMLDDQNATIRNLKQNLENKIREHNVALEDITKMEERFREEMKRLSKISKELELEESERMIEGLQKERDEYYTENEKLHATLLELSAKLKARNESIAQIEAEVSKVQGAFRRKEERLLLENESLRQSHDILRNEMQKLAEEHASKVKEFERERGVMVESIRKMKTELQSVDLLKDTHKEEMAIVLSELERQRQKFSKLKDAISDT